MLVPIRVGMILPSIDYRDVKTTCPHTRGDDPCSGGHPEWHIKLVPIRVGMILIKVSAGAHRKSCPHTRGDDPQKQHYHHRPNFLSPYAWG